MKTIIARIWHKICYHSETVIAIPLAVSSLLVISLVVSWVVGNSLTEDITTVVKYAIRGVGFLMASGSAIAIKSRGFGDVDETACDWKVLLVDSLSLWIVLLLSILAFFGASLWL
ncbi:MAG: hypothetical protein WCL08_00025 [Verrucomicrobiota bacterium]